MKRFKADSGVPTAFISTPRPTKKVWDHVQGAHHLTLSCCIVMESPKRHAQNDFFDLMVDFMEC